jgi:hypothetical protein
VAQINYHTGSQTKHPNIVLSRKGNEFTGAYGMPGPKPVQEAPDEGHEGWLTLLQKPRPGAIIFPKCLSESAVYFVYLLPQFSTDNHTNEAGN